MKQIKTNKKEMNTNVKKAKIIKMLKKIGRKYCYTRKKCFGTNEPPYYTMF